MILSTISKRAWFHIKLMLLVAAISLLVVQSWDELPRSVFGIILLIALFGLGYWFGKITCGEHVKKYGMRLTIAIFALLNVAHSMIDGISLSSLHSGAWFPILAHETVRQTILYAILYEMLTPFKQSTTARIISLIVSVTGVWLIGLWIGDQAGSFLSTIEWLHPYLAAASFILIGDIFHHMLDEYKGLRKTA